MANDCLVTRLKGVVDNTELPELGVIYLDFKRTPDVSFQAITIASGGDGPIHLTFKEAVHVNAPDGQLMTNVTLTPNNIGMFYIDASTGNVSDFLKIDNVYNLVRLWASTPGFDFAPGGHKGLTSLDYAPNLIAYGAKNTELLNLKNPSITAVSLMAEVATDEISIDLSQLPNIETIISSPVYNNIASPLVVLSSLKTSLVKRIKMRIKGTMAELPAQTRALHTQSTTLTGDVESFVTKARAAGRTTGWLAFNNGSPVWLVTYNGTPIKDLDQSVVPVINSWSYLTWTADSISWASSAPSGSAPYTVDFGYMSYQPITD